MQRRVALTDKFNCGVMKGNEKLSQAFPPAPCPASSIDRQTLPCPGAFRRAMWVYLVVQYMISPRGT